MTKITLFIDKSIEENAAIYYEKAKRAKKKLKGAQDAFARSKHTLAQLIAKQEEESKKIQAVKTKKQTKQEWYHKFRWFVSSEGFLCVGGRDAMSNEILVKKHTEKDDVIFHADIQGSPFFVIKTRGKKPGKATLEETAQATASYSKAWKMGIAGVQTYYIKPEQATKQHQASGKLPIGSFYITGKTTFVHANLKIAIGSAADQVIGGPVTAIQKQTKDYVVLQQGKDKTGAIAKAIQKKIGGTLDEISRFIPPGGSKIQK